MKAEMACQGMRLYRKAATRSGGLSGIFPANVSSNEHVSYYASGTDPLSSKMTVLLAQQPYFKTCKEWNRMFMRLGNPFVTTTQ